jgi:membrane associated rhomboid family serine protease
VSQADPDSGEVIVRASDDQAQSREWAVVVQAAGVPCRVERSPGGWGVVVASGDESAARTALAAYDAEVIPVGRGDEVVEYGPTAVGVMMAVVLWAAAIVTGFRAGGSKLFMAGEGSAERIVAGQPWRIVTALFLHADFTHLAGNVVATAILGTAVCRLLGPGLGLALIVISGAVGNLMNAYLRGGPHVSVGASTSIFGAVGILAGLAIMRARAPGRRPWVPFAAGLALLALLGTGEHADLAAHFFGFQTGLGLGLATAVLLERPPGSRAQRWLAATTIAAVVGAWLLAAHSIGR